MVSVLAPSALSARSATRRCNSVGRGVQGMRSGGCDKAHRPADDGAYDGCCPCCRRPSGGGGASFTDDGRMASATTTNPAAAVGRPRDPAERRLRARGVAAGIASPSHRHDAYADPTARCRRPPEGWADALARSGPKSDPARQAGDARRHARALSRLVGEAKSGDELVSSTPATARRSATSAATRTKVSTKSSCPSATRTTVADRRRPAEITRGLADGASLTLFGLLPPAPTAARARRNSQCKPRLMTFDGDRRATSPRAASTTAARDATRIRGPARRRALRDLPGQRIRGRAEAGRLRVRRSGDRRRRARRLEQRAVHRRGDPPARHTRAPASAAMEPRARPRQAQAAGRPMSPKPTEWEFELREDIAGNRRARLLPPDPNMPTRRRLRAFSHDPSRSRYEGAYITLSIPYEPLAPGPAGAVFVVEDLDGKTGQVTPPVDLEQRALLMEDGLTPSSSYPVHAADGARRRHETTSDSLRARARPGSACSAEKARRTETPHPPTLHARGQRVLIGDVGALCAATNAAEFASYRAAGQQRLHQRSMTSNETSFAGAALDGSRPNFCGRRIPTSRRCTRLLDLVATCASPSPKWCGRRSRVAGQGPRFETAGGNGHQFGLTWRMKTNRYARRSCRPTSTTRWSTGNTATRKQEGRTRPGAVLVSAVFEAFRRIYQRKTDKLRGVLQLGQQRLPSGDLPAGRKAPTGAALPQHRGRVITDGPPLYCTFRRIPARSSPRIPTRPTI